MIPCTTTFGPDPGKPCIFPFKSDKTGITYNTCTTDGNDPSDLKAWCSTQVNDSGEHVSGIGKWGYCEQKCQTDGKFMLSQKKYKINDIQINFLQYFFLL